MGRAAFRKTARGIDILYEVERAGAARAETRRGIRLYGESLPVYASTQVRWFEFPASSEPIEITRSAGPQNHNKKTENDYESEALLSFDGHSVHRPCEQPCNRSNQAGGACERIGRGI